MIEQKKAITKVVLAKNFNWSWYNRKNGGGVGLFFGLVYFMSYYKFGDWFHLVTYNKQKLYSNGIYKIPNKYSMGPFVVKNEYIKIEINIWASSLQILITTNKPLKDVWFHHTTHVTFLTNCL